MSTKKNPAAVALGKIKSTARAEASRKNGLKGGRPRRVDPFKVLDEPRRVRDANRLTYWLWREGGWNEKDQSYGRCRTKEEAVTIIALNK